MLSKKIYQMFLLLFSVFLLTGCGKEDPALTQYKEDMTSFCTSIKEQDAIINGIDPASETAAADLLSSLDVLNEEFTKLAQMQVPEEFVSVEDLASEAGSYMSDAVAMYHDVFEAAEFDAASLEVANENYERAMKRVQYIGDVLMGNIPDGEDVTVSYDDEETDSTLEAPEGF